MDSRERLSLLSAADALNRAGNPHGALERVRLILSADPGDTKALMLNAAFLLDLGRTKEAVVAAKAALAAAPDSIGALHTMARAEAARGHLMKARSHIERALELGPNNPSTHALEAAVCLQLRDSRGAAKAAESALQFAPENPGILAIYAITLVNLHRYEEADEVVQRAYAAAPEDLAVLHARGLVALVRGRQDEAEEFASLAAMKAPSDRAVLSLISRVRFRRNPVLYFFWLVTLVMHWLRRPGAALAYYAAFGIALYGGMLRTEPLRWFLIAGGLAAALVMLVAPQVVRIAVAAFVRRHKRAVRIAKF